MHATAKTLTAVGIAFAAGVAVTASLMPSKGPSVPDGAPRGQAGTTAAKAVEVRRTAEPAARAWSDPVKANPQEAKVPEVRTAQSKVADGPAEADAVPKPSRAPKLVFGKDVADAGAASPAGGTRDPARVPAPPPRPLALSVPEGEAPARASVVRQAVARPSPAASRVPHALPSVDEARRAETRRVVARVPERREARPSHEPDPREARPSRREYAYAYAEADPYREERFVEPAPRAFRPVAEARGPIRQGGGSDGLMRWLSGPGQRY